MFNVTGSEIIILLLLALVVLGPEKLPDAIRRFGKVYGELRRMSQGFQDELRDALDEPMRELRSTADMARRAIEEPAEDISGTAKGVGQAATDAFAAATKFSAAPVVGGNKPRTVGDDAEKDQTTNSDEPAAESEAGNDAPNEVDAVTPYETNVPGEPLPSESPTVSAPSTEPERAAPRDGETEAEVAEVAEVAEPEDVEESPRA